MSNKWTGPNKRARQIHTEINRHINRKIVNQAEWNCFLSCPFIRQVRVETFRKKKKYIDRKIVKSGGWTKKSKIVKQVYSFNRYVLTQVRVEKTEN